MLCSPINALTPLLPQDISMLSFELMGLGVWCSVFGGLKCQLLIFCPIPMSTAGYISSLVFLINVVLCDGTVSSKLPTPSDRVDTDGC